MKALLLRAFYGPGDWLAERTSVRQRRAIGAWLLILAIFPGTPIWYVWRDALWLIGLMGLVAIWIALAGVVSAETPVEGQ